MSRLIVKGLPANCTEQKLREFFKKYGQITDCSLKYTPEGVFRRFAFVGFDSDANANKAQSTTQGTFMGSYRLTVEECKPFGDDTKPRAWSKYAKDSSAYKRKHGETDEPEPLKRTKTDEPVKKEKKDPKFEEFLAAKGEKVEKAEEEEEEEEDMSGEGGGGDGPTDAQTAKLIEMLMDGIEGDTQLSLIFTGLPPTIKQKNVKEWLAPIRIKALRVVRDAKYAASFVTFNRAPDVRRALPRDGQFLGGFKIGVRKVKATDGQGGGEEEGRAGKKGDGKMSAKEAKEDAESRMKEEERVREQILDTGRLFLRNLPFSTKEEDLQFAFKKFGEVADIQVIVDKKSGACKGIAIVEYVFPESAVAAYAALDGRVFKGRMMHILPGAEKRGAEAEKKEEGGGDGEEVEGEEGEKKASYKKEKATKMKANAAKSSHSWNALFLGANAVADSLAEKLGVSKADLLNAEDGASAGVRLALAETRLVRETRDFLVDNGIQLDAFSRPAAKRSAVVMLAKNLPAGVETEELERMFGHHGDVEKILLPPEGGVTAIIRMANAVDAKKAFQALAYTRFRTQPLYLEWAPHDVFKRDAEQAKKEEKEIASATASAPETAKEEKSKKSDEKKKKGGELTAEEKKELRKSKKHRKQEEEEEEEEVKQEIVEDDAMEGVKTEVEKEEVEGESAEAMEGQEEEEETVIEPNSAVFVKNLSFETDDESLTKLFSKYHIKMAQVSRKLDPARPGQGLSMGFGFVQFYTTTEAKAAIKHLQGALLDGHCIELKLSHREMDDKPKAQRKQIEGTVQGQCTKILVRNIPFQAKAEEVEQLFQTFGEVKNIRVPRKVGSRAEHRGFGFVDFLSIGEAKRAMEALCHSTHLYGRRLVLEWAKADDSVQEMRDKTKDKFSGDKKAIKKQRKQMEMIEKDLAKIGEDDAE